MHREANASAAGPAGLPEGYEWAPGEGWRVALRSEDRATLLTAGVLDPETLAAKGEPAFAGRGRPMRVALPDGTAGVLRRYRHGGLFRGLTGRRFLGPPRPLRELLATARAETSGAAVPRVLAAWFRPAGPLLHEGFLLTREVTGATDLGAWLRAGHPAGPALRAAGRQARRLHEAGVWHADLHAKNVLLAAGDAIIIDLDRARVLDPVPRDMRMANLLRFDRSLVKLARRGPAVRFGDRLRFFKAYFGARPGRSEERALLARCRRSLSWHRLFWGRVR
ncbi:MAG: phosphotransferase [Planctomycetes bacterium]|jgi:3-deoxy-D-manno-octulosonic acid kinase|nr:phosphotransferase [Planctomycetota bacterium]